MFYGLARPERSFYSVDSAGALRGLSIVVQGNEIDIRIRSVTIGAECRRRWRAGLPGRRGSRVRAGRETGAPNVSGIVGFGLEPEQDRPDRQLVAALEP